MSIPQPLIDRLTRVGQQHLAHFYPTLPPAGQKKLLETLSAMELESLPKLIQTYVTSKPPAPVPANLQPARYYPNNAESPLRKWDRAGAKAVGEDLLKRGKVAAFCVAGGQGSRLGFEGPKGCYPAGAVTKKPLFAMFAEGLLAAAKRYGKPVPWYIMTSPLNHAATIAFFEQNSFFGLDRDDVMFFPQGVMPSFDMATGRILLAAPDEPAMNPDGHGGSLKALFASGAIDEMNERKIQHISYFQVDNPLVKVVDPVFLGLHASASDSSGEMSSKMIPKTGPEEKVGVFCSWQDEHHHARTGIIEYSDMPTELVKQTNADGSLRFIAGSIAVHAISVAFVEKLNTNSSFELPYHRAEKKVPHVDLATGKVVSPEKNNAVKLERFVFDALPLCKSSIVYETDRVEEFAPIKNATGVDSVESCRELQTERAARWLEKVGVKVPRDAKGRVEATIELSPLTAMEPEDLRGRVASSIARGTNVAL